MSRALVLALALCAAPARAGLFEEGLGLKAKGKLPEAAAAFERVVAAEPRNAEALAQLATVQGWLNRYGAAVQTWNKALRLQPRNAEYRVGLARVLYWRHDYTWALKELDRVLSDSPRDAEAMSLRGDILLAGGDAEKARAAYLLAQTLSPVDPALAKKLRNAVLSPHWRLDAGFVSDNYTNFRRAVRGAYAQVGRLFGRSDVLWLRYDWLNEFSKVDNTVQLGGAYAAGGHLLLLAAVGVTPKADFRPRSQVDLGAEAPGYGTLTPLAGYRALSYQNGTIHVFTPGLRWQAAPWLGLEGRYGISLNADDSTTKVVSGRLDLTWSERLVPYAGIAHGKEALPPQRTATITYYSAGCVWNISPTLGLRVDYSHENRHEAYAHNSIGAGGTVKF